MEINGTWETCSKCKQKYKSKNGLNFVCPHCHQVRWGDIITFLILGLICLILFLYISPILYSNWLQISVKIVTGILGLLCPIAATIGIIQAFRVKKQKVEEVPTQNLVQENQLEIRSESEMANSEHVSKWKEGLEVWIAWRAEYPEIHPNLRGADLSNTELAGADLEFADLSGANLSQTVLNLAFLLNANFSDADMHMVNLSYCVANGETKLGRADLKHANLTGSKLIGVDLNEANLQIANLCDANLNRARLRNANLSFANLRGTDLSQADIRGANFSNSDLSDTNLKLSLFDKQTVWPAGFHPTEVGAISE